MRTHRKKFKNKFRKWYILPVLAGLTFILTETGARNPHFIEIVYTRKIYPVIAEILSFVSDPVSFSLDDLFYLTLIFMLFILIFLLILKRVSYLFAGKLLFNILAGVYISFYFLWGFNYFREDLNTRLKLAVQTPETSDFIHQMEKLITATNQSYCSFDGKNLKEIDSLVEASYKKNASVLALPYPSGKRKDKSITLSGFFAKAGISGYYGPFFNEVHVNKKVLPVEYPFVLAHEKAHQFGITSEAEANFYGWLICTRSSSKHLQYSANLQILRFFLNEAYELKEYQELTAKIDEDVKKDFNRIREHWKNLRNETVDKVATKANDTYLKTNKIEKGIEDYTGVVKYIMDFSSDTLFHKTHHLNIN